jgi:hypothetical protein
MVLNKRTLERLSAMILKLLCLHLPYYNVLPVMVSPLWYRLRYSLHDSVTWAGPSVAAPSSTGFMNSPQTETQVIGRRIP